MTATPRMPGMNGIIGMKVMTGMRGATGMPEKPGVTGETITPEMRICLV